MFIFPSTDLILFVLQHRRLRNFLIFHVEKPTHEGQYSSGIQLIMLGLLYTNHVALFKRTRFTSNWTELTGHNVMFSVCPLVPHSLAVANAQCPVFSFQNELKGTLEIYNVCKLYSKGDVS